MNVRSLPDLHLRTLARESGGKILLFVIDGLGGLPHPDTGKTELEQARLENLDALAARSSVGRVALLPPGFTPGSGPGHLSLFGHDPLTIDFGRGVLEALGSGHDLQPDEIAARGNFCSMDPDGRVSDRRAGRPDDATSRDLCERLNSRVRLDGAEVQLIPGKQHRFTFILRKEGLGSDVNDNDPQSEGKPLIELQGKNDASRDTAALATEFLEQAREILSDQAAANGVLLRGFSGKPPIPSFQERARVRAAGCAVYPMYRGVAQLCGMDIIDAGTGLDTQRDALARHWDEYDFFFVHTKAPDQAGHGGDFAEKVAALEAIDAALPSFLELGADVFMVTGDHSTPCIHREHSWHPVPLLIHSNRCIPVPGTSFDERGVLRGDLGIVPGPCLLQLALAHAGRLDKFGA